MDYRLLWFVKCINKVFEIGTEKETVCLFGETLNKDGGALKRQLVRFLETSTIDRNINTNIFYVYTTTVKKVIKEEIEIEEELSEHEIQLLREPDGKKKKKKHHQEKKKKKKHVHTEDITTGGESPASDSDKESDEGKSRDGYSSPDTAIQLADEDGLRKHSEKLFKKIKVIQEKIITLPELHVHFGCIKDRFSVDFTCMYFVKNTNSVIPVYDLAEEADYYMPSHFLIGNKTGCLVKMMKTELERIWIPSVEKLLTDPFSHDCTTTRNERSCTKTLASTSVSSTFLRISHEIKAQHDYEILIGERPDDYTQRVNSIDLEKIISLSELFMLESSPLHGMNELSSIEPLKTNFLIELKSLLDKLKCTIDYMSKKQSLSVTEYLSGLTPDNVDETAATLERTPSMILQCVNILENWNSKMKNLCSSIFEFKERDTIHSEFTFWKNSEASVRSIIDELESEETTLFLRVIEKTSNSTQAIKNIWEEFRTMKSQFIRSCGLAKDNLKYIALIMEHYKDFISADFCTIINIIPIWFDDLRTVWVLSPYFGKDVNMLRLLLQISHGLCENVGQSLGDLKLIFKNKNIEEISEMSFNATKMLDVWSACYLETRKSIELSKFKRWEFDKCVLFNKIEYIKRIAKDIHKIVATISEFLNILGPELRSIIKDMIGLDVMISRVKSLYKVFDAIDFDLFCEDNVENWNLFLKEFYLEALRVEEECKLFIDWCFNNLRSCKEAYLILEKLQKFTSRPIFKEQLRTKYEAILRQYENELTSVETNFLTHKNNPPISRHHPPVSGSIFWVRMLFDKIKEPITVFQSADEFSSPLKYKVVDMYKSIIEQMKCYEKSKLTNWTNKAKFLTVRQMNSNILVCVKTNDETTDQSQMKTHALKIEDLRDWLKYTGGSNQILSDQHLVFKINFDDQVYEIIEEAEMMENLGINLPKEIQMLLAKKNGLLNDIMKVKDMINAYNLFVSSMNNLELAVLKHKLKNIEDYFYTGLCRYNWLSISINTFTNDGLVLINETKTQFNNIQIVESHIFQLIISFENVNLFPLNILTDNDSLLKKHKILPSFYERFGLQQFRHVNTNYQTISKFLIHLELYLFGSKSGACKPMIGFYSNYKHMILNSILKMYLTNLDRYNQALLSECSLIKLTVNITKKEVSVFPNMYITYNNIVRNVSKCLTWLKTLPVWQKESCVDVLTTENKWVDENPKNTLYEEVVSSQDIQGKIEIIQKNSHSLMVDVNKYLKKWRRFQFLWNGSKIKNRGFSITDTSIQDYENIFNDLKHLLLFFTSMPPYKKIRCVKLDLCPIVNQMKLYTRKLILFYADQLIKSTRQMMHCQGDVFDTYRALMNNEIKNSHDFLSCLSKIEEIRTEQVNVEIFFQNLNHRIYVLEEAGVTMRHEDTSYISYIQDNWTTLQQTVLEKKLYLEKAKAVWSYTVKINIEMFVDSINSFLENYDECCSKTIKDDLDLGLILINEYDAKFTDLMQQKKKLMKEEGLFNLKLLNTETFDNYYSDFQNMKLVYSLYEKQKSDIEKWSKIPWLDIKIEFVREAFGALMLTFKRLPVLARKTYPAKIFADYLKELRLSIPILVQLKNSALKVRHWKEILNTVGIHFNQDENILTFGVVLKIQPVKNKHIIKKTLSKAVDENNVEQKLIKINERWNTMSLDIEKCFDAKLNIEYKLCRINDVLQMLEDDQITMQKMMNLYSVEPFLTKVETWQKNLSTVNEVLNKWWFVQQKWIYLAEIYSANEMLHILPEQSKEFNKINQVYKEVMVNANRNSKVLERCLKADVMSQLMWLESRLDMSQRELNSYITEKRNGFPRFYFISDNDLLFIFGNSDPIVTREHIVQVFDNIKSLTYEFKHQCYTVTAMTTFNDEVLVFKNDVIIKNTVDKWMLKIIDQMQKSNRYMIKKAILELGNSPCSNARCDWLNKFPCSVCLNAENVWWTVEVEHSFSEMQLGNKFIMKQYLSQLNNKINDVIIISKKEVSESKRIKYIALLNLNVYHRDVVESFITNNVTFKQSFEWDSILKSYWIKNKDNLYIGQCSGIFNYGYEYMGSNKNIVITPLTNRIFLTFTQALTMCLGGAIHGSTGTGKTETTLALAKILGNLCKIINCNDGLNHEIFSHFLNGICQSKIWGLFTKFNRISQKTLSVISTLLFSMKWALFENKSKINCRESDMYVNPKVGIFITLNIEESNGEKKEIDKIIKDHFRPVICLIPDFEQICFTVLYSEGFLEAKVLSKKISLLYKLCREGLSKPFNHTFDLRSLKLAINTAKNLVIKQPELDEYVVILKVLRDLNLPKLIDTDVPLFLSFIADLFPNIKHKKTVNVDFNLAVEIALKREKFIKIDSQIEKINQIQETLTNRNAIAIIGPTSGGKSVIVNLLCETLNQLKISTKLIVLNPKAFTKLELYGYSDPITKTWNDGLLTNIFRNINQPIVPNNQSKHFILFDGDIDSIWINDLNQVMDDNRMLTLSNGEKIRIKPLCNLLFEVGHLAYLAPSTVSRMGIVYVDPNNLSYKPFWSRWLEPRNFMEQMALDHCFKKYVPVLLDLMFENEGDTRKSSPLKTSIPQTKVNMINQLCFILDAILPLVSSDTHAVKTTELKRTSVTGNDTAIPLNSMISFVAGVGVIEAVFIQALYLSLGALLTDVTSRLVFDENVKELSGFARAQNALSRPKKQNLKYIPCDEPTWYDYFLDFHNLEWVSWKKAVPEYVHDETIKFNDILVPTVESTRLMWILKLIIEYYFRSAIFKKVKRPTIIIGELSSGKTATIKHFIKNLEPRNYIKMAFNFSARTSSLDVQKNIETNLERHSRKIYGPPTGKRLVYFIDDLNLPQKDECGTQPPIALLKGIFDKQGMYGRLKCFNWKDLVDICFFAAMSHTGGGRNKLDPRFLSLCSVFSMPFPTDNTVRYIFSSILSGHTTSFSDHVKSAVHSVVDVTLSLYKLVLKKLHQTPEKFIYVFNLYHISFIINGLTRILPNTFTTTESFVRVWRNEFTRVISDRLIYQQDREMIERHLTQELKLYFPMQIEYALRDPLLFGDCRNAINANNQKRIYEDLIDYDSVFYLFQEVLLEYKKYHGSLDMVLFNNALDHLIRIHRTLRMERGHVVLIGPSGIGKKSLSKLAAFTSGYEVFINTSLCLNHELKINNQKFINDLKNILTKVGIKNQPIVFIIDKVDAIEEDVLEHINNILTNGFVPSLYSNRKENLEIVNKFKNEHIHLSDEITTDIYWDMFLQNCLNNLHVVLLMSPGNNLRLIFQNYPGFVKQTYIDWIHQWPKEALNTVAENVLNSDQVILDDHADNVIKQCIYMHISIEGYVREFFKNTTMKICFTFKHLVDCIYMYKNLVEKKSSFSLTKSQQIQKGLEKIDESTLKLCKMNEILLQQDTSIKKNDETYQTSIVEINRTRTLIEDIIAIVNNSNEELSFKNDQIKNTREQMKELIDKTLPVLSTTKSLLNEINLEELIELKYLESPPESAMTLLECMAILKGLKDMNSWKNLCDMIEDPDFLKNLHDLDVNKINQRHQTQIRTKIKLLKKTIDLQTISKVENTIFNFIESLLKYCSMYQDVIPLKNKLDKSDKDYADASFRLKEHEDSLKNTRSALSNLEKSLNNLSQENTNLKKENGSLKNKFKYADKLMKELNLVHERWTKDLEYHNITKHQIIGNCLLAASFLIYAGPFSFHYRQKIIFDDWYKHIIDLEIPIDLNFKLNNQLINEKEIYDWNLNGLPCDENSIQNGILITQSTQFALCIDPHKQAFNWIKNHEQKNSLKILSFADTDYFINFKRAIQYGQSIIFIDFENMDLDLKDLLNKNSRLNAIDSNYIEIEDQKCKYHKDFRLYLMTKQTNPKITTSIYSNMTVINCSITQQGLEDQLLNLLVKHEVKELECKKELMLEKIFRSRETLKGLTNSFLTEIINCAEPLINNTRLLNKLEDVKSKINSCSSELKSSFQSMSVIDQSRNVYKSVSKKSALFYMALDRLKVIDSLYQFSIDSFIKLFINSIELTKKDPIALNRESKIINQFTNDVLEFSCINTYEKHNILFLFQIACALDKDTGNLLDSELIFFIKGYTGFEKNVIKNPTTWLSNKSWQQIVYLNSHFERFSNLIEHISSHTENWKAWCYSEHPEFVDTVPIQINNHFDILMLIRCFRTDRVYCSVENYVCQILGVNNQTCINKKNTNLESIHKKFSSLTPCTLILNNGSDPVKDLTNFAGKNDITGPTFKVLSLGTCEDEMIYSVLKSAMHRGNWLTVQNCNFSVPFLYKIENLLEQANDSWHPNFRLWLVFNEDPFLKKSLPISLLLRSLKVIIEPSNHMKICMQRVWEKHESADLENKDTHPFFKTLLYTSLFLHGILSERKKYDKVGWCLPYNFNYSEYTMCRQIITIYLAKCSKDEVPWDSIKYLIGNIVYGGKVIDKYDRRVLSTYVDEYFGDFIQSSYQPFSFYTCKDGFAPSEYVETERKLLGSDEHLKSLRELIDKIPLYISPEVCGLNSNVLFGYHTNLVDTLCADMIKLYPFVDTVYDRYPDWEEVVKNTAEDILKSLPVPFNVKKVKTFYGDKCSSPNIIVLLHELERFNALLEVMRSTLSQLAKVFLGKVEMNSTLEEVSTSLYAGHVPMCWGKLSPQTVKSLAHYIEHVLKQTLQYSTWSQIREPLVMWLPGLHAPKSYLTSLMQLACRKYGWSIEHSKFYTSVTRWTCESEVQREPEAGCYVTGLYLEGARWDVDGQCLAECMSRSKYEKLPILAIIPAEICRLKLPKNWIAVPVYETSKRGELTDDNSCVFEATLNTSVHESFWILRGVCVVMNFE